MQWVVSVVCWEAERGSWSADVGKEMGTVAGLPKGWLAGVRKGRHLWAVGWRRGRLVLVHGSKKQKQGGSDQKRKMKRV